MPQPNRREIFQELRESHTRSWQGAPKYMLEDIAKKHRDWKRQWWNALVDEFKDEIRTSGYGYFK